MNRLSLVCRTNFTCTILHTHCQFCNMFWHTKVPSSGSLRNCYRNTVKWSVVWLWLISRAINGITNPKHYLFHYLLCEHNSWFASFLFTPTFFLERNRGVKQGLGVLHAWLWEGTQCDDNGLPCSSFTTPSTVSAKYCTNMNMPTAGTPPTEVHMGNFQ
jgi:hypothetical protein